jgi:glutamate--cysteine ligase
MAGVLMARDATDSTPISSRDELIAYLEAGCKPASAFRVGTEHEKFPFYIKDLSPVPYEGPQGIRSILDEWAQVPGWLPIWEGDHPIGLVHEETGAAISLEPGGQFELSGAPLSTIHHTAVELDAHLSTARAIASSKGIAFLGLGHTPLWSRQEVPVMPKGRYRIMMGYMPKVGTLGLDMMLRTCTVQANLDFSSEADMVKKLRVTLALQPILTALFANSPFTEGKPNGFLSMRSQIWRHTDPDRTGMMPFAFESGMGFERYVDYVLDVPMYFVKRGSVYHDVAGASFRDFLAGKLSGFEGQKPTQSDWANHLSTLFPEVRLKRYLEMRGADVGSREMLLALPALCVGLLYDQTCLDEAWQLVRGWTPRQRQELRDHVPREGLYAVIEGRTVKDIAKDVLALAQRGLQLRAQHDAQGRDETQYLTALYQIVETGHTHADDLLKLYHNDWKHSVTPVFETERY